MVVSTLKKDLFEANRLNSTRGLVSFNKLDLDVAELELRIELASTFPNADCWIDTGGCPEDCKLVKTCAVN